MPRVSGASVTASARKARLRFFIPLAIFTAALVAGVSLWTVYRPCDLKLGSSCIQLERVSTKEARAQGLGGRQNLPNDQAMLFEYELSNKYCFWMKDMQFPIDIVWINSSHEIVAIEHDVQPETYPKSFCSDQEAKYVLEFAAGVASEHDLQVGQQLQF